MQLPKLQETMMTALSLMQVDLNLTMSDDIRKMIEDIERARDMDPLMSLNISAKLPPLTAEIQESVKRAQQEMQDELDKQQASTAAHAADKPEPSAAAPARPAIAANTKAAHH